MKYKRSERNTATVFQRCSVNISHFLLRRGLKEFEIWHVILPAVKRSGGGALLGSVVEIRRIVMTMKK